MKTLQIVQKIKGTEEIAYNLQVTGVPENLEELVQMVQENDGLLVHVLADIETCARAKGLARAKQEDNANGSYQKEHDWLTLSTTQLRKLTAKAMCERLEKKALALAGEMTTAVSAGNFEEAQEIAEKIKANDAVLQEWKERRELQRQQRKNNSEEA